MAEENTGSSSDPASQKGVELIHIAVESRRKFQILEKKQETLKQTCEVTINTYKQVNKT